MFPFSWQCPPHYYYFPILSRTSSLITIKSFSATLFSANYETQTNVPRVNMHYHMLKVWIWNNKCKVDRFEVIFRSFVSDSAIPAVRNNMVRKLTNPANPCLPKGSLAAVGSWLRRKAYGVKTNCYFRTSRIYITMKMLFCWRNDVFRCSHLGLTVTKLHFNNQYWNTSDGLTLPFSRP